MGEKMKVQLNCTICNEAVESSNKGIYVWGENTDKYPFRLVHKGRCDSIIRKNYLYSCEIDRVIRKIGANQQYNLKARV